MNRLFHKSILSGVVFALSVFVSACGSGGGGGGGVGGVESSGGSSVVTVATVEIQQTGLVLTESGATRQLSAVAYDANGNPLDASFSWSSTTPADIDVDSSGKVTAMKDNGSSQIIAEANGVRSAPLLTVVAMFPAGAIPLTDAQIVGDPVETDPEAEPSFDNTYKVVLSGISPPAVGELLINTDSKPVAGQVVAVDPPVGGQTTVTLRLVSLREMFPNLTINEKIDLSQAPVEINPDIAAAYDVQHSGNTYTFTSKPAVSHHLAVSMAAAGSNNLGPFKCEADISAIQLSVPPVFSLAQNFSMDLVYTPAAGLERLVVKGEIKPKVEVNVTVSAGLGFTFECAAELFVIRIPVGGPLSFFVAGLVPFEAGFAGGVNVTAVTVGLGVKAEASAEAEIGIACPGGAGCEFVKDVTGSANAKPILNLPSLGDLRFEPSIGGFGRVKLAIGNPFFKSLRLDTFYAQAGPKLEGSFASKASQIGDTSYKSDYKASLEAKAGVGIKLGDTLKLLGLSSINVLELSESVDIAKSPGGAITANRDDFAPGDQVNFHVELDPGTVNFFPLLGPYNAYEILLVRDTPGNTFPIVGRVTATSGQTAFDIPFNATDTGSVSQFTVFVVTTLLPFDIFALEVGVATPQPAQIAGTWHGQWSGGTNSGTGNPVGGEWEATLTQNGSELGGNLNIIVITGGSGTCPGAISGTVTGNSFQFGTGAACGSFTWDGQYYPESAPPSLAGEWQQGVSTGIFSGSAGPLPPED
ncbi:MAG: hypothetical protein NUV63_05525 [Gallionella sp.]|nr:hypothetical protein [Gallionella sp.]